MTKPVTKSDCDTLIEEYVGWLRKGFSVSEIDGSCELTTQFLDRHNDHLQVYIGRRDHDIRLSDDGYILADLDAAGVALSTPKRRTILDTFLRGFGVRLGGKKTR